MRVHSVDIEEYDCISIRRSSVPALIDADAVEDREQGVDMTGLQRRF